VLNGYIDIYGPLSNRNKNEDRMNERTGEKENEKDKNIGIEYNDCMLYRLRLTSLLGKIRAGANNDVSSIVGNDICDEELLNTDVLDIVDGI
jgi:hypothetical protein